MCTIHKSFIENVSLTGLFNQKYYFIKVSGCQNKRFFSINTDFYKVYKVLYFTYIYAIVYIHTNHYV